MLLVSVLLVRWVKCVVGMLLVSVFWYVVGKCVVGMLLVSGASRERRQPGSHTSGKEKSN